MDPSTAQSITLGIAISNFALTWGVAFYVHLTSRSRATNESLDALKQDHAQRIARLEEQHRGAPTHEDLGKLYDELRTLSRALGEVSGSVRNVQGELKGLSETQRLILARIAEKGLT